MSDIWITVYTESGKQELTKEEWRNGGKRDSYSFHRVDGPAVIRCNSHLLMNEITRRDQNGCRKQFGYSEAYWIEGICLTEHEYNETIQEVKDMPLVLKLTDPRRWVREFK